MPIVRPQRNLTRYDKLHGDLQAACQNRLEARAAMRRKVLGCAVPKRILDSSFPMNQKRIGILTSGGDCPGLNAVIRGASKTCWGLGYDCIGFLKGYEGLHDPVQYINLTPQNTTGILNQGGTILGSTNKGRFAATVGIHDRLELKRDLLEGVKTTVEQLRLEGLICIGGDGSLAIAQQFHEFGIPVVGVPKTIDNDLLATAFTFGFDSAVDLRHGCARSIAYDGGQPRASVCTRGDGPACRLDRLTCGRGRRRRRDSHSRDSVDI